MLAPVETVKDVPAVRAVITSGVPTKVASVELQVVLGIVKVSSTCNRISLLAVTAVVEITSVLPVPVGNATAPAAAEPHVPEALEQFVLVW